MFMKIGLVCDIHAVYDPAAAQALNGTQLLLHAGDVGHHGGHQEVLQQFARATGSPILAVAGNVDVTLGGADREMLPGYRLITAAGWRIPLVHVIAPGPKAKVHTTAATFITAHKPDIAVFGHSHKAVHWQLDSILYINPGSAGPARFKLARTVDTLTLPCKQGVTDILDSMQPSSARTACNCDPHQQPQLHIYPLPPNAPRRLAASAARKLQGSRM